MKLHLDPDDYTACPEYNDWLDTQHAERTGALDILGYQPRPSFVLFSLSQDTYQAAFADFSEQRAEELVEQVFSEFPSPIAYYFYRFDKGYESQLQRLHLLRDSWETIVDVLHAIAVAECRLCGLALADPISFSDLFSDSVAQRLLNIERIFDYAAAHGVSLDVSEIATIATLQSMRDLNQSRNAFSHSAAQSEAQARVWIAECYEEVLDVIDGLRGMAQLEVLRYMGQVDGSTLRCEVFKGHSSTRTIQDVVLTEAQVHESGGYFQQGHILVLTPNHVLSPRPLVHCREDATGHTTRLCLFRKTRGGAPDRRMEYEVVGEATRWAEDRAIFQAELTELRGLFGLGAD